DIACVGAKLLFGDGRIQHAGVTLHDGSAFHHGYGERVGSTNWIDIELVRNFSAVTAACLMIRRELFLLAGGFDESFPIAYNDIEFCVRLRRRGYRHVYTPYAVLYHHESSSRRPGVARGEGEHLRAAVGRLLWHDPFAPGGAGVAPPARVARTRTGRWLVLLDLRECGRPGRAVAELDDRSAAQPPAPPLETGERGPLRVRRAHHRGDAGDRASSRRQSRARMGRLGRSRHPRATLARARRRAPGGSR